MFAIDLFFLCVAQGAPDAHLHALPLIKRRRAAFNVSKTCMHFHRAACRQPPSKMKRKKTAAHAENKGKVFIMCSSVRFTGEPYLHFVWRKHFGVYFAGDDGHHLQFHIYRWHYLTWWMRWGEKNESEWKSVFLPAGHREQISTEKARLRFGAAGLLAVPTRCSEWCWSCRTVPPTPPAASMLPSPWLHIDVITVLTFALFYAALVVDGPRWAHCRAQRRVYPAFLPPPPGLWCILCTILAVTNQCAGNSPWNLMEV